MSVVGDAVRISANGSELPSISDNGTLLYRQILPQPNFQFAWVDDAGNALDYFGKSTPSLLDPSISPDETRVAITDELSREVWIQDLRGSTIPLTTDKDMVQRPGDWFSDNQHLLLWTFESGEGDIYWLNGSGSGERQLLVGGPTTQWAGRLSPDEKWLAYYRITTVTARDVEVVSLTKAEDGSYTVGEPQIFVQSPLNESTPEFHPSGKYLSYQSDISGQWEIYVRSFPDPDESFWSVTSEGAYQARWHPNGRELYYVTLDDTLTRVTFDPRANNPFGEPESLFHIPWSPGQEAHTPPYAFGRTTGRLGVRVRTRDPGTPELVLIQNWLSTIDD